MGLPFLQRFKPPFRSPAQLFAKGATGAWYDPSSLWGAADHLPRRNLLYATEDISGSTYWSRASGSTPTATTYVPNTTPTTNHYLYPSSSNQTAVVSGRTYVCHARVSVSSGMHYQLSFTTAQFSASCYINFNLNGGAVGTVGAGIVGYGMTLVSGSTYDVWASAVCSASGTGYVAHNIVNTSSATKNLAWTASGTETLTITRLAFLDSTTANNAYQKITDWTTELYAHAASKNVPWLRRNRFLNTATLSTQTVTAVTATPLTVSFKGTGTITFSTAYSGSLVGTGANDRVSLTFTPSAGNLVCTVTGTVTDAQCEVGSTATAYQPIGASWEAQYAANAASAGVNLTMYQDSAGATPVTGPDSVIGKLNDLSGLGYHAIQSGATGLKPTLRLSPNGYWYIQRDLSDDALVTTFPNLGTACALYLNDGSTVTETTGITLNGALTQSTPAADYGRIYLNAPTNKLAQLTKWLKAKAGLA